MPVLERHPTLLTAQLWDATCNVGLESIPPQAGEQHLALKHCRQEVGLGLPFCQLHWDMNVLRSSEASFQECHLLTSSQVLLEDQASVWDSRHLQLKPEFEGKTRPVPLHPATSREAVPNRRGFVPGEAPGYVTAGNSPLEWEAIQICSSLHSHGVPPHCQCSQGRGGEGDASRGHAAPWAGSGHPQWTMGQRHSQGAQPRNKITSCKNSPPLIRLLLTQA